MEYPQMAALRATKDKENESEISEDFLARTYDNFKAANDATIVMVKVRMNE